MNETWTYSALASRYPTNPALYPYALWFRAAFIGLLAAAGGVAALAQGNGTLGGALAWIAVGTALTAYSSRRLVASIAALDAQTGSAKGRPRKAMPTRAPAPHLQAAAQ